MFLKLIPTVEYCERATDFIIKRPFYALSNIAFIVIGFYILNKGLGKIGKLFGFSSIIMGAASLLYDSSYLYLFQMMDLLMMHLFVGLLLYLNLSNLLKMGKIYLKAVLLSLVSLSFMLIVYFKGYAGNIIFAVYVLTVLLTAFLLLVKNVFTNAKYLLISLGLFFTGFSFWCLDFFKIYCDPTNVLNGRSIFHLLASLSIYYLFIFYTSQKRY